MMANSSSSWQRKEVWKELKSQLKSFSPYPEDDVLFHHVDTDSYSLASLDEFVSHCLPPLRGAGLTLSPRNIKRFVYGGNTYILVTLNNAANNECSLSKPAFAFGHFINGFSYIFKKASWDRMDSSVKEGVMREPAESPPNGLF
jgi:hypothetical protein